MSKLSTATKRLLLGRPFRSDTLGHDLLPKRIALPVFASDALSSVAYAPEEIFLVLSIAGLSAYAFSPWIGLAVAAVLVIVVASYRQNVRAYPSGGGDYEIATKNLGATAGLTVGSALMVDYVLTVAVSLSSAAANIGSAVPFVAQHKVLFAIAAIAILAAVNLRGLREAGKAIAFPTYAFVACMLAMLGWGLVQIFVLGEDLRAESAEFELVAEQTDLTAIAFIFLLARAFSSGCAALTGVEAISTGVPAFRKPRARNAATTLFMLGAIAVTLFLGVVFLAQRLGVVVAENPATQLRGAPEGYEQKTLVAQLAQTIFSDVPAAFFLMAVVTAVILVLAANTAYNGFPVLASVLAQNRYLPRQLHTRGDRLAFSNGIVFLSGLAIVFVWVFDAEVTKLIQLYIVGVFVAFSLGQAGMVRHWTRFLATETDPASRGRMQRSRSVNVIGFVATTAVLLIVLVTKFTAGAWIAVATMVVIFGVMKAIRRHYDTIAAELEGVEWDGVLPSRTHSIVLVSTLHLPTLRALAYARATRPDTLEAITVNVDEEDTRKLVREWERSDLTIPLKVVESPYREITRPVLDYVRRVRRDSPRDVVTVFIPEYVVGHWWEQILHNQSALRLKSRLLFQPGVMVTSVPWQLRSSAAVGRERIDSAPGAVRRGLDKEEQQ
ncbi:APC family permease [Rhodococcus sp. BL-253-APC-6A1W]|uniref:amino acid permease n=1 Tax=Rhodococcus sp. BL-253-APC-6A1W TaxID=2725307 RepID=UPI00146CCB55|nr:APC family permease [Rhodococcus sp. BL-253-APC-6A1W]